MHVNKKKMEKRDFNTIVSNQSLSVSSTRIKKRRHHSIGTYYLSRIITFLYYKTFCESERTTLESRNMKCIINDAK